MGKMFLALLFCFSLLSCSKKEKKCLTTNKPYLISVIEKNEKANLTKNKIPPPPPCPYGGTYGTNFFIIDKESNIYYFQRPKINGWFCGTEMGEDTIPYFMNLKTFELIQIPKNGIADFVLLNLKKNERNIIHVASQLDTLSSQSFHFLINALDKSKDDNDFYFIRRTHQEEDTVLKYKKNNEYYDFKDIKWDKTKIKLPEMNK